MTYGYQNKGEITTYFVLFDLLIDVLHNHFMPYSSSAFDSYVKDFLLRWKYFSYLDIGVGAGKYGKMVRSINKSACITGVEIDREYIDRFKLESFYDFIIKGNALSLVGDNQKSVYDVVFMGDVLEHLLKSEGLDLINFLIYRCKKMIVIVPENTYNLM